MSITTTAAAGALDALAFQLARTADAAPTADAFLATLHAGTGGVAKPTTMTYAALVDNEALAGSFDAMHAAVKTALAGVDSAPSISSHAADGARQLVQRLADAEQAMTNAKAYPHTSVDVSDIALDVRSRIADIVGRGQRQVHAEAGMLRAISA